MRLFAETCEAVAATTKKNEKVRRVAEYLCALSPDEASLAALFLTGRAFPRCDERNLTVGGGLIWQAVAAIAATHRQDLAAAYRRHGDIGDMALEVLPEQARAQDLSLVDAAGVFQELAARRGASQKLALLESVLRRARPIEAKYFLKIITGDLRIGLKESLVEEAVAWAFKQPLKDVQRANMLLGDIGATLRLAAAGSLSEANLRLFHPVGFMLANPVQTAGELTESFPQGAFAEDKYDGIRAQVHKAADSVKLFSRTLDEVVEFPELLRPLRALPGEFILDGEIIGWREGRPRPFTELQQRLGRKHPDLFLALEVPVSLVAFDVLYQDGQGLLGLTWMERRWRLEALLAQASPPAIQVSNPVRCQSLGEFEQAFDAALARGNEGLMAKAPGSSYTPGRRGRSWLKLKRPFATLDVVVTAVEYGHGKRHGLLSDYTFSVRAGDRLVSIGKAYSGLTDAEIIRLTDYFKQHTLQDGGFERTVEPSVVMEVAFNNIQRSSRHQSGYALRFPRIARLRPDKLVSEIDTLERVKELYERQNIRSGG